MNKIEISNLDLTLYSEKLENGLSIFVVPKQNWNNIYVTFTTNYGSVQNEFVPNGKDEMIKVPEGVAHFLEHKLFEQEDGVDPFTFFGKNGASANASTSSYKTTYLFEGTTNFKENLEYLLDFVQSPYFTDENVEKEKGIIIQEIKMYEDNPYRVSYEKCLYNTFVEHPIRYSVGGSVSSVNSITKDDLYTCYSTFYHPSNMFIVITGNVDPEETIEIIKNNQAQKVFEDTSEIKVKDYDEPDQVFKEKEILKMNVTVPKVMISFKFNIKSIDYVDDNWITTYLSLMADLKYGPTSEFQKKLLDEQIIIEPIEFFTVYTKTHVALVISAESKKVDTFIDMVINEMSNDNLLESDFIRKRKTLVASTIFASDNIYRINSKITNDMIRHGFVVTNDYEVCKNLSFDILKRIMSDIKYSNISTVVVEPK